MALFIVSKVSFSTTTCFLSKGIVFAVFIFSSNSFIILSNLLFLIFKSCSSFLLIFLYSLILICFLSLPFIPLSKSYPLSVNLLWYLSCNSDKCILSLIYCFLEIVYLSVFVLLSNFFISGTTTQ